MPRQCPEIFSITCVGVVNSLDRRMRVPSRCSRLRVFSDGPGRRRILLSAPSTRLENRAGDAFRRAIDLATSLKTYTVFEGIEVPVRCWKIGPPTRRPRHICGSGHAREAGDAVDGTGFAGVRGHARSHRNYATFKICRWNQPLRSATTPINTSTTSNTGASA